MATRRSRLMVMVMLASVLATGCERSAGEVWEDTKTASRHVTRGVKSLGGKQVESRQVASREEFSGRQNNEFIALEDTSNYRLMTRGNPEYLAETQHDAVLPQPKESPGDPGSAIPGIEKFKNPEEDRELAKIFQNLQFPYNSSVIKGTESLNTVRAIADYLKKHPDMYIFVEGHCDERGPQAYNLALGARRANAIRNVLIKEGVDLEKIFTISFGKEKPLVMGHDELAWQENRRGQFKVFHKNRG